MNFRQNAANRAEPVERGRQDSGLSSTASFGPAFNATLRGMYFTVKWTARVDGPGPQPGVPQWDGDALVIDGTHYVQPEWSTITIYSDATPTEPPPVTIRDSSEFGTRSRARAAGGDPGR